MVENNEFKLKNKKLKSIITLLIGIIVAIIGLLQFIYYEPVVFESSYRKLLTVGNGSLGMIIGAGFIIGGLIQYMNRNQKEIKENHEKRKNWLKYH